MSEEEIINHLKDLKENLEPISNSFDLLSKQAIQGLLDLYSKEKEENRIMKAEFERLENIEDDTAQLKLLLKEEKEKNVKLLDEAMVTYFNDEELKKSIANYLEKILKKNIQKDYISKNKIKEKIKECEKRRTKYNILKFDKDELIDFCIEILKELLEE